MKPQIEQIESWARYAGKMAIEMRKEDLKVEYKNQADLVTRADKAIEAYLLAQIEENFPSHTALAEETGMHKKDSAHKWYIDPIDGTLNYAHGLPEYSISIAYAYEGELQVGVVYCPEMDEMFSAVKGQGAWLNGKPIRVSKIEKLIDALLITGFRHALIDTPQSNIDNFIHFARKSQTVRRLGSAALDLAYVAAGRAEGFWEIALNPWDVAAGILLVREAGGIVEGLFGEADLLTGSVDILSANPAIFPQMREVLEEVRKLKASNIQTL